MAPGKNCESLSKLAFKVVDGGGGGGEGKGNWLWFNVVDLRGEMRLTFILKAEENKIFEAAHLIH